MFLSEWREFPSAPYFVGKDTWWQLTSRFCWYRTRPWHASELVSPLVGLRTYQHPDRYVSRYLLIPWCRVLLEKLTSLQLVKQFPAFYGTRRFITAFTSAHHLSLSWASSMQSIPPSPNLWRSVLILWSHLRLDFPSVLFPPGFHTKSLYTPLPLPYALHAPPISSFSIWSPEQYWLISTDH